MKMSFIDMRDYVAKNGFSTFEFAQNNQPDGADNALLRHRLRFDKMVFQCVPPCIHLISESGSISFGFVEKIEISKRLDEIEQRASFIIALKNGEKYRICASK